MYRINEFLTREERLSAIQLGAVRKLASMGMTPSSFSREIEKRAADESAVSISGMIRLALGLGIPIGAISYAMKSAIMPDTNSNLKLKRQLDEYNDIVHRYRMSASGGK